MLKAENGSNGSFNHKENGTFDATDAHNNTLWEEFSIDVPWGTVQGKWWGSRKKQPVLAIHGWQDNCGSFDRLCPLLPAEIPILCIDLPGHGKSSPYPKGMQYYIFWDGITLIRRIVKYFNWENVILMGHSLGGALSFMYAACFPTEVSKFISIDIAGPTVRNCKKTAMATGTAIDKFLSYEDMPETQLPCYSYEEMIALVIDAYAGSVDEQSVKILMERGMAAAPPHLGDKGYHFARDVRLKVSLLGMLTTEQVLSYAELIRCKVLNIRATPGMKFENPDVYEQVIDAMRQNAELLIFEKVPGTHHLHLMAPESVAPIITNFLRM